MIGLYDLHIPTSMQLGTHRIKGGPLVSSFLFGAASGTPAVFAASAAPEFGVPSFGSDVSSSGYLPGTFGSDDPVVSQQAAGDDELPIGAQLTPQAFKDA